MVIPPAGTELLSRRYAAATRQQNKLDKTQGKKSIVPIPPKRLKRRGILGT